MLKMSLFAFMVWKHIALPQTCCDAQDPVPRPHIKLSRMARVWGWSTAKEHAMLERPWEGKTRENVAPSITKAAAAPVE